MAPGDDLGVRFDEGLEGTSLFAARRGQGLRAVLAALEKGVPALVVGRGLVIVPGRAGQRLPRPLPGTSVVASASAFLPARASRIVASRWPVAGARAVSGTRSPAARTGSTAGAGAPTAHAAALPGRAVSGSAALPRSCSRPPRPAAPLLAFSPRRATATVTTGPLQATNGPTPAHAGGSIGRVATVAALSRRAPGPASAGAAARARPPTRTGAASRTWAAACATLVARPIAPGTRPGPVLPRTLGRTAIPAGSAGRRSAAIPRPWPLVTVAPARRRPLGAGVTRPIPAARAPFAIGGALPPVRTARSEAAGTPRTRPAGRSSSRASRTACATASRAATTSGAPTATGSATAPSLARPLSISHLDHRRPRTRQSPHRYPGRP